MRFLLNGGEAIVARQARKFLTLLEPLGLPRTAIRPAWGMSETSSGVTYSDSFALATTTDDDPWVSLGRPIPGVQLRIVNQAGELVGERVIGRLQAKGAPISPGYYGNSKANEIAFTKDGWLNTGDVGFLRDGCLTITGREKEMIIINGMNFDYHSIETAVEELDGVKVSNTAALAICDGEAASDRLAVFFTPILWDESSLNFLIEAVRDKILRDLHINADFIIPVEDSAMPKTSIGKIERPQLKQRFDRGDFRTAIEKCNLRKNDDEMLPRWFHRRIWRRREHQTLESLPQIGVLVFVDAGGLGNALCKQLQDAGCVVVAVEVGPGFAQSGDCCYCINPANRDDYKRLFRAIAMQGKRVSHIIHLWSCDKCPRSIVDVDGLELAQRNGLFSLLYLVQAISATRSPEQRLQLLFITNAVEQLSQLNSAAYEKSPALGLLKSVSYEFPWIRARHVDLEVDQTAANVHCIIRELRDASRDEEVAYRQGRRLIPMLVDLDLTSECQRTCRIKKGGIYLVTGGLGGVGFHVAQYLLKEHHARVLVVGRSELSDEKPPSHVSAFVARSKVSKLGMLQQLGEVVYQRADVASITEMASAIECGMSRWGVGLDGVFHLAGHLDRLMLSELTSDSLMAALLPKVAGSWILDQLLEQRPNTLFVSFSSVVGCFGGLSMGAYAAACRFQSAFADYQFRQRNIDSYCLNWSTWKGVGMNAGCLDDRLSRERGFMSLSAKQAVHSLDIALCQEERQVQIGLDHNKAHMRKHFGSRNVGLWQPIVYYGSDSSHVSPKSLAALKLTDRFGTAGEFVFVPKDELAELGGDAIDRGLYGDMLFEATTSESNTNQMTSIMHGISQIWCDTLELSEVGNDTNFFDVGGHSLVIPVVLEKIGETFNVHVDVIDIFRYPTISALARHVHDRLMSVTAVISDSSAHVDSAAREHIATRRYAQRKRRGIDLGINDRS
jgi:NADP-dependent 3-hydroxy acid dehydrogenase YdfG